MAAQIAEIAKIQIDSLSSRLAAQELSLKVEQAALFKIAEVGFDPLFGARPLKRAIQTDIENPLAQRLLAGEFEKGQTITVRVEGDSFDFSTS